MDMISKATTFMMNKHDGQNGDDGSPYYVHPLEVYKIINIVSDDINLMTAALLHDTLEDTDTTYEELKNEFNEDVANLVNEVTHEGQKDSHGYYFPRLKTRRGIILKFADRISNLNDMSTWDEQRQAHYLKKSKFWKSE